MIRQPMTLIRRQILTRSSLVRNATSSQRRAAAVKQSTELSASKAGNKGGSSISTNKGGESSNNYSKGGGSNSTNNDSTRSYTVPIVASATVVIVSAASLKYLHDHIGGFEGITRSLSFYSLAVPKYVQYRYHMYMQSPQQVWDDLDTKTSKQGLDKILQLHGFYIKCGQACAANIGNAFPKIWQQTMSILQNQVPAQPFEVVDKTLREELGQDYMTRVFKSFEKEPIGAASIGQVHRAVLREGNIPVVVKVCYPNVERLLRGDVRTITLFARVAQPVHVPVLNELEAQLVNEFDYVQEAKQLDTVRNNLTKAGIAGTLCQVPQPYLQYCTKKVLVMQELQGDRLVSQLEKDLQLNAQRHGQSSQEFIQAQQEKQALLKAQGKELQGPTVQEYDRYIQLLNAKRKLHNLKAALYKWTIGLVTNSNDDTIQYQDCSVLPLNHAKLVDDLIHIHGHEVLVDGFFNSDTHPGNFMLLRNKKDGSAQIGLIDYGQVKRIDKQTRHLFANIIIALCDNDKSRVVELMTLAGYKSKYMNPDVMYQYARVAYDMDNAELTQGKHMQLFMEDLQKIDPIIQFPPELIMVSRCSIFIRGLCHALHQSRSVAQAWRPIAEKILQEGI